MLLHGRTWIRGVEARSTQTQVEFRSQVLYGDLILDTSAPRPPNVTLLRALWSLLDGIWGVLKGTWGVLVDISVLTWTLWVTRRAQVPKTMKCMVRYPKTESIGSIARKQP